MEKDTRNHWIFIKTKPLDTVNEEEKKLIVSQIRETLPKRRGIVDAIKPFIKNYDELSDEKKNSIILDYFDQNFILFKMDLTLEELRYIQDEDYYVDIEEWLKRDLYEKQRKIDNFVIEHEQERKELLGYYENIYYKATPNKYIHHIYVNTYNLSRIRTSLAMGLFSASFATVALGFINPALPLLLFYDYYKIISYMLLLNRVIISIRISKGKTQVRVDTLNYLGYMRKPDGRFHNITSLKYIQPYVNNCLNPNQIGLLPSLSLAKRWLMKVFKKVGFIFK